MVDRLDDMDGDADLEPNGDEQDGVIGEDEPLFSLQEEINRLGSGPGCRLADEDLDDSDREPDCPEARAKYFRPEVKARLRAAQTIVGPDGRRWLSTPL
jgi:hypothetical protein